MNKMLKLPVRKCYHVAKVTLLFVLVIAILTLFEQWRGGKRSALAYYADPEENAYEKEILEDEARIIPGLGEGGNAAYLTGEDKEKGKESEKKLAMNVYLSDRIAYNRTLSDHRNPACTRVQYDAELPSASVIIIFHNEPYSVVIRTLWSVINSCRRDQPWHKKAKFVDNQGKPMKLGYPNQDPNSEHVYLKEIILVDDNSTLPQLKGKLSHYIRTRLPPDLIRIIRLPERRGITVSRFEGSKAAVGSVLIFLDCQCETTTDWMRPLLQRIKDNPHAVLTPIIDMIVSDTFMYDAGGDDIQPKTIASEEEKGVEIGYGLTAARLRGARAARGSVLVFLDAHCEAQEDWLRPLLQRIRDKRDAVLTPIIDVIDQSSFQIDAAGETFQEQSSSAGKLTTLVHILGQVGGFTFTGHFTWIDVPDREKRRRGSDISPTWSPTMAGGLFAMDRQYYWELGAYDEQMAGWGGENLEMSFRVWQCGGTLETIPCSRVGHVFRAFHPYSMPASSDTHGINTARMAEVWMDEYAELFYLYRPDLRNNPKIGDVTHRKILREKLHCKNFQWYLDNIYMEKFVPVRDAYGYGRIQNPSSGLCIDTLQREGEMVPLGVYPCHATLAATQHFSLSLAGQLRDEENCAMIQYNRRSAENEEEGVPVLMTTCRGHQRSMKWRYVPETQHLTHAARGLCLDAGRSPGADLRARPCGPVDTQRWKIDYTEDNGFRLSDGQELTKQETRLLKLRGQKRKSRSLLSMPDKPDKVKRSQRRHRKRTRGNKNKFILKLIRTASNGSKEHLEVEIHCKHQQLFPNNTFVRDLVSILNDKDIKVINNGRVFEKNRISTYSDKEKEPDLDRERDREREREKERDKDRESEKEKEKDRESDREKDKEYERETRFDDEITEPALHRKRASTAGEHRIIIEDFVGYTTPRREAKRKHRKHHKQTSATKPVHTRVLEDRSLPNYKERFSDDSLQLTDPEEEHWDSGNTRFRDNTSHTSWRRAYEPDKNNFHSHNNPPVKVLMRSNLTFKLADSFFKKPKDLEKDSIDNDNAMFNVDMSIPEDHLKFGTTAAAGDIRRAMPLPPTGNESSDSKDNSDAR